MSKTTRQIQTPGAVPAQAAPSQAPDAGDDLAEFDTDVLPAAPAAPVATAAPAGLSPELAVQVQAMIDQGVKKALRERATAKKAEQHLPTIEAAKAMAQEAVAQGMRPRAILTTDGYYVHPEMARVKQHGTTEG